MERIMSARDLSRYLAERFRRDGCFLGGVNTSKVIGVKFEKGELIIPIGPDVIDAVKRQYENALSFGNTMDQAVAGICSMIGKEQAMRATCVPDDTATFFAMLNRSDDDWRELSENAVNDERKANRARERALKRSRRNTKNPKKKGKRR